MIYFILSTDRVTITQTGSISIFSSKEQELEQRAGMMKRLAFTIFCSEPDQYQKAMPEIQGTDILGNCFTLYCNLSLFLQFFVTIFHILLLRMFFSVVKRKNMMTSSACHRCCLGKQ